jgi:nucleoside-diphosphate-sugar epimerase
MNILLTGGTGFVGRNLTKSISKEHSVFCITRKTNVSLESCNLILQDLSKPLDYSKLPVNIDTIIHLAQSPNYKQFPEKALDIYRTNCDSTVNLLDYGRIIGIKNFIYASSGSLYLPSKNPFSENNVVNPIDFYNLSKNISEQLVNSYSNYFDTTILRFFFVYGPNQKNKLIPNLIDSIKEGKTIYLNSKEGMKFTPTYIDDAVAAIEKSISLRGNNTLNISGNETISIRKISETIGKLLGREPIFEYKEGKEVNYIADNSLMKSLLQINETTSVEDGLRKTIGY